MANLFGREISINIGGTLIRTKFVEGQIAPILRASFRIEKTIKKEPNKANISIYNLNPDNRKLFQEQNLPTIIEAGYIDNTSQIFSGDLTFSQNKLEGEDWVTILQAGDGAKQYKSARINTSFKGPVKVGDVLRTAADAMGLKLGNVAQKISQGSIRGALTEFTNGAVLSGKAEIQLDKVVKSMGYSWSIQDGQLQLLDPTETIGTQAILLTPGTGLIGTPEAGEKGFVKARSLLQPSLLPGQRVQIVSKNEVVSGFFRAEKCIFVGDTWGTDWYVDIEARPL